MSDSYTSFTVCLKNDMKGEAAEKLMDAIKLLHNVLDVKSNVADYSDYVAQERALDKLRHKLKNVLWPDLFPVGEKQ